eukprot:15353054-Ditylum_brightwellii.AAC.1
MFSGADMIGNCPDVLEEAKQQQLNACQSWVAFCVEGKLALQAKVDFAQLVQILLNLTLSDGGITGNRGAIAYKEGKELEEGDGAADGVEVEFDANPLTEACPLLPGCGIH